MKKLSAVFWILNAVCIVVGVALLGVVVSAQQVSYESAAVGRVVGNTPGDMRAQLVTDEIKLEYATYYGSNSVNSIPDISRADSVVSVVGRTFPDRNDAHVVKSPIIGRWGWDDVKGSISSWTKRSLLLLEARGDVKEGVVTADSPAYFDETILVSDFDWDFNGKPLVVFDSDYAGVHVPKLSAFVSSVAGDAVVIAPTAVPDRNFVKVFVCNLGKYRTLGETYMNARNNYYWQSNKPSGIALMSYELYGNPASLVSVPDYDEAAIREYCGDFIKNYTNYVTESLSALSVSASSSADAAPLTESRMFRINDYSVANSGNFSVLVADGTKLSSDDGDLVLPVASLVQSFPLRTVVTGVDNVRFLNPVDFTIPNLPSWAGGFVERECGYESRNASLEVAHTLNGNRLELFTTIRPVEVVNCTEGKLRLYTEVGFDVNYFTYSPVLISDVIVSPVAAPNDVLTMNVTLANVKGGSFSGELALSDGTKIIVEKSVEFSGESELFVTIPFSAGNTERISYYTLAFVQNGEEKAFYGFSLRTRSIDVSLKAPSTAGESGFVRLLVDNRLKVPVQSLIQAYTVKGAEVTSQSIDMTLQPSVNEVLLPYEGLRREGKQYDFLVIVPYGSGKVSASTVLVTNHPPVLKQIGEVIVTEGDTLRLSPEAIDVDGDAVSIRYSGRLFGVGEWQTKKGDAGVYEVKVTASDGLLSASQTVKVTVVKDNACYGVVDEDGTCNNAPVFDRIENRTVRENEGLAFVLTAADEEKDVLVFSSSELPEGASLSSTTGIFSWTPASGQSGTYAITFTVSDGFSSDSEDVVVTVQGVNHAPVIERLIPDSDNLVVDEGRSMRFEAVGSDLDGDRVIYRWRLDGKVVFYMSYYVYSPNYTDSGEHVISVSVYDRDGADKEIPSDSREFKVSVRDAICSDGETRTCDMQLGVCRGSIETCSNGKWSGCTASEYGGDYEKLEKSCDMIDNDCDGTVDEPENLFSQRPCGNDETELLSCVNGNWVPISECLQDCGRLGEPCCLGNLCRVAYVCNYAANRCEISGYWGEPWE